MAEPTIKPDEYNHVCFCADGRYIKFIIPALESLLRASANPEQWFVSIIMDHAPSIEFKDAIRQLCPGRNQLHIIDPEGFKHLIEVTHISRAMYYRLLIPELINADRVLYLDCDIIVRKDICDLISIELNDNYLAAAVNPFYDATRLGIESPELYFNSGVLLINAEKWRKNATKDQIISFLSGNSDILRMPDQDALNVVLKGKILEICPTYNCQVSMLIKHQELEKELTPRWNTDFLSDPAIMHFSAGHKQWHSTNRIVYSKDYLNLSTHLIERRKGVVNDFITGAYRKIKYSLFKSNPYFY
ncbi:Glycosyl transferase family 8 [Halopseudomonas sabulinigri]|uniref:Glycosyl transferase family 8 n=1 Tax=Halopseudomonas sabulinigri TaxID=472181 RepID=A0A1H1L8J3_9GAMM|nr:glycosyltransferase family 8 protein [Halopseudomonas sabulinigri]SDR70747.1 Glycosyl transferase family 8 [Halopseudomonas sabulinigri]